MRDQLHLPPLDLSWALVVPFFFFSCYFTSTETTRTIRNGEPRKAMSTFTQLLSSDPSADDDDDDDDDDDVGFNVLRCRADVRDKL